MSAKAQGQTPAPASSPAPAQQGPQVGGEPYYGNGARQEEIIRTHTAASGSREAAEDDLRREDGVRRANALAGRVGPVIRFVMDLVLIVQTVDGKAVDGGVAALDATTQELSTEINALVMMADHLPVDELLARVEIMEQELPLVEAQLPQYQPYVGWFRALQKVALQAQADAMQAAHMEVDGAMGRMMSAERALTSASQGVEDAKLLGLLRTLTNGIGMLGTWDPTGVVGAVYGQLTGIVLGPAPAGLPPQDALGIYESAMEIAEIEKNCMGPLPDAMALVAMIEQLQQDRAELIQRYAALRSAAQEAADASRALGAALGKAAAAAREAAPIAQAAHEAAMAYSAGF